MKKNRFKLFIKKEDREHINKHPLIRLRNKIRGGIVMIICSTAILIYSVIKNEVGIKILCTMFIIAGLINCLFAIIKAIEIIDMRLYKKNRKEGQG